MEYDQKSGSGEKLVTPPGFEPRTFGLIYRRPTNWAMKPTGWFWTREARCNSPLDQHLYWTALVYIYSNCRQRLFRSLWALQCSTEYITELNYTTDRTMLGQPYDPKCTLFTRIPECSNSKEWAMRSATISKWTMHSPAIEECSTKRDATGVQQHHTREL